MGLILSASTIYIIESVFTKEEVFSYAWRIPFFISVFGAMVALYIRRSLLETTDFLQAVQDKTLLKNPIHQLFKNHNYSLFKLFFRLC